MSERDDKSIKNMSEGGERENMKKDQGISEKKSERERDR